MYQPYDSNRPQERSSSPYQPAPTQTQQQVANSYPLRNHEVNVSRGIFTNRKENMKPETTPRNKATNSDQLRGVTGTYNQVMKDFLDNDLQSQITQFRNEMIKIMNESLRDFNEKSNRNQEAISIIKESVKNHGHNIDKLDQKIEEYHSSLEAISEMFKCEIDKIKTNLAPNPRPGYSDPRGKIKDNTIGTNSRYDQKIQRLENQQQDLLISFERLKDEVTQSIQVALDEYGQMTERDSNDRINKISHEITLNMEQKIAKVINHLDGKVQVLEKQIQNFGRPDDAIVDNLRFHMEDKVSEQTLSIRQQIQDLYQMIETKSEAPSKMNQNTFEVEQRIDRTRQELDILKSELASVIEQVKTDGKVLNSRLEEYERKFNEECRQLKNHRAQENLTSKTTQEELERKVSNIERQFDEVRQEQKALTNDMNIHRAQVDSFKTTSAINFSDLKNNQSHLEDVRLKKLEQLVDQLTKNVENIKPNVPSPDMTSSPKLIETNVPNELQSRSGIKHENFTSFGFPANMKPQVFMNYDQQVLRDQVGAGSVYRSDARPHTHVIYPNSSERTYYTSPLSYNQPVTIPARDIGIQRSTPENSYPVESFNKPSYGLPSSNIEGTHPPRESEQYYYGKIDTFGAEPTAADKLAGNSQGFENANLMKRDEERSSKGHRERKSNAEGNEEDEVEVVYQINENGYLMDEDGNFIYDDQGEMIKLNEKQIQRLRENNLLEEENSTTQ